MDDSERNFFLPDELSDVTLQVEGQKLHAHRQYLAEWSGVWRRHFLCDHKLSAHVTIDLPGKCAKDVVALLQCIYSTQKPVTGETVAGLLALAEEFEINKVKQKCEEFLLSHQTGTVETLALADKYQLHNVYRRSLQHTRGMSLIELETSIENTGLNAETETDVYKGKVRELQNQNAQLKREVANLKTKCSCISQDKAAMQEALYAVQRAWDAKNKRCYKHVNDYLHDFSCVECNERVKRDVRELCSGGLLRLSELLTKSKRDKKGQSS